MTMTWTNFETLYTTDVRAAADAWIASGAEPSADVRAEQVGELVLLRTTIDRSISPEDRATRLDRVGAQLLTLTSPLYDIRESDSQVVELIRDRHGLVELHRRRQPATSHTAAMGEPILRGVHPGWPLLSTVLVSGTAILVGYLIGAGNDWQVVAFAIAGAYALLGVYGIARGQRMRVDRTGIHVRGLLRSRSYAWPEVRDITIDLTNHTTPMGPSQTRRMVLIVGNIDSFAYSHARCRLPLFVEATAELRDELIAYGIASGAQITEMPPIPDNSTAAVVRMMIGIPVAATVAVVVSEWAR